MISEQWLNAGKCPIPPIILPYQSMPLGTIQKTLRAAGGGF